MPHQFMIVFQTFPVHVIVMSQQSMPLQVIKLLDFNQEDNTDTDSALCSELCTIIKLRI